MNDSNHPLAILLHELLLERYGQTPTWERATKPSDNRSKPRTAPKPATGVA